MTSVPDAPPAAGEPGPRLVAQLSPDVKIRLRMLATLRGKTVGRVLNELLDRELPTPDQLAAQMQQMGGARWPR